MISQVIDYTAEYNINAKVQIDVSGWNYVIAQFINPTGVITFQATNDAGAVLGVSDGNSQTATNWITIEGLNLSDNTPTTTTNDTSIYKFDVIGKFIRFNGVVPVEPIGKLLVYYSKML